MKKNFAILKANPRAEKNAKTGATVVIIFLPASLVAKSL
jgi:hypothetical protein